MKATKGKSPTAPPSESPMPAGVVPADVAELKHAQESRRAAPNLMEDAVQARQAMEKLNAELRASEANYRAIFEGAAVSLWKEDFSGVKAAIEDLRAEGVKDFRRYFEEHPEFVQKAMSLIQILDVNDTTLQMFEAQDKSELLGSLPKIFVPESVPVFMEELLTVAQGRTFMQAEALLSTVRGNPIWVLFTMTLPPATEAPDRVLFSVLDITDRKKMQESERQLASLVESSGDAIISKSLDGIIQSWNAAAERLFGYTADQAVGRPITMLIPSDRAAEEDRIIARLRAGERVEHFDTVRLRSDGQPVHVSLTISPIKDETGRVVGASKIARDITERKQMEDALREAGERKNEFLAMLAHELRNPLAPIRNALQAIKLKRDDPDAIQAASEMMERQISQMVHLVDDLLDVSRISRGKIELHRERVELASVVFHAVETARPLVESMNHELTVTLPPEPVYLHADPLRLAQVFGNLLNNACKFTSQGGRIWLSAEVVDGGRGSADEVVVQVKDTGIGIAADQRSRIFEMFAQGDTSLERSVSGLGIGLSLVKNLVELHEGTVEVQSPGAGQGSEFTVRLPLCEDQQVLKDGSAKSAVPSSPSAVRLSKRVLVVDDNHDSATSLALLLKLNGNETQTAYDGLEAVHAAETFRPDMVLLDIGLPKLNGYEAARRIREQPWGKDMTLVALTGWGQEEDRRKSKEAGFNDHLVKPVDHSTLMKLLSRPHRTDG